MWFYGGISQCTNKFFSGFYIKRFFGFKIDKKIAEYRKKEAMRITQKYRPDLLKKYNDIIINNIDKKEGK